MATPKLTWSTEDDVQNGQNHNPHSQLFRLLSSHFLLLLSLPETSTVERGEIPTVTVRVYVYFVLGYEVLNLVYLSLSNRG